MKTLKDASCYSQTIKNGLIKLYLAGERIKGDYGMLKW